MKIDRLILENFRGVGKTLELPLEPDLTVLAGVNGAGKSTVLDALAILLSWVVARVRRAGGSGQQISELSIHNSAGFARIRAEAIEPLIRWQLVKRRIGYSKPPCETEISELTEYVNSLHKIISGKTKKYEIPLFAYYPTNRVALEISLRASDIGDDAQLIGAWQKSLAGSTNFNHFFDWFRNREDIENEGRRYHVDKPDSQLESVRRVVQVFLPGFTDLSVRRSPLRMVATKDGAEIRVDQLSDGEKCLIAFVGDLARRLAIANPNMANPLKGKGIILIDEIDLHIHPAWQRTILTNLTRTFPNCQFVVSTHSPQVLGEAEPRQIRLLTQEENGLTYYIPDQAKGLSSNEILDELMRPDGETLTRNRDVQKQLDKLAELIDRDKLQEAKALIDSMKQELHGNIPELIRADSMIFMLEGDSDP